MRRIDLRILFSVMMISLCCAEDTLQFEIISSERIGRETSKSVVSGSAEVVIIPIKSKRGIGSANIKPRTQWPKKVELHIHLKGLENIEIDNGKSVITSSYSLRHRSTYVSVSGKPARQDLKNIVKESHPFSLQITPVSRKPDRAPGIPLDGYFKIEIPSEFLKNRPQSLKVNWIDFYR
jgi:hypothetical protein